MGNEIARRPTQLLAPELDYLLIDGSGSMQDKWGQTIIAAQSYLDVLAGAHLNAQCITTTFDTTDIECIHRNETLGRMQSLLNPHIGAHFSGTPLYDAINVMGRTLKLLKPAKAHIIIATDGDDTEYGSFGDGVTSPEQARAVLDYLKALGYQVTFLGVDFNSESQGKLLGSNPRNVIAVETSKLRDAAEALGHKRIRYSRTGEDIHFTGEEKSKFGGYLTSGTPTKGSA